MENKELSKVDSFTKLVTWQEGHRLVLLVYKLVKKFPRDEHFGLTDQMRRAVVSITSNIAEGFSRGTYKDKNHFYYMALGSLTEAQNQLIIAKDVDYISEPDFIAASDQINFVNKLLRGLINKTHTFITND